MRREIDVWLNNKSTDKILSLLTEGRIAWDTDQGDFDWANTTALPKNLKGAFYSEPLHVDLSWAQRPEDLTLRNPQFLDTVATLSVILRDVSKSALIGEEVRQRQRLRFVGRVALIILFLLVRLTSVFSIY